MHSELDFRPVQIIAGHVIYNSPYKYWPNENDLYLDKISFLISDAEILLFDGFWYMSLQVKARNCFWLINVLD